MARRLVSAAGCVVVGEAAGVASAVEVIDAQRPDVVLLDVMLPNGNAADVLLRLTRVGVRTRVLLTSSRAQTDLPVALDGLAFLGKADLTVESFGAWLDGR